MARLLTSLLVVFAILAESGVGNSLRERRQVPTLQPPLPSRCISSTCVTPSLLSTPPAECSLGKVKHSLEADEELRAGGDYLMPEAVPCNGRLVFAETCAFLNRLRNINLFRLTVALLRETNDVYQVINSGNINIISSAPNATQGCGNFTQQWPVNQGDRIGVRIRNSCDASNRTCPAQANLIDTASCASALYLPLGTSPLTNFTAVGVNLNVRVSIVPTASPPPLQSTCIFVSPTPLQSPPTGCSLGKVEYSLENSQYLRTGGIYLMPEAVPCNGRLVFAEICAFFNRLMDTNLFRLTVGLFREGDGVYQMVRQGNIGITSMDTKGCKKITQDQGWPVSQGDRIGVIIMDTCDTSSGSMPACPAQANLIDNASCASALYLPLGSPLTNFRTVSVNLNVRVSIEPTAPPLQPTTMVQRITFPIQSTADLLTTLDSFDLKPSALHSPSILSTADTLQATSTRSFGSAYLSSSSISKSPDPGHESEIEISHGVIGGIVAAALAIITALVILLTISAYVYWRKVLKKRKGKYKHTERVDSQAAAVVSYHLTKDDASYEEPTENMVAKESVNKCTNSNSTDSSYRMSFRNRGYSEANAYSLFDEEVEQQTVTTSQPYSELHSAEYAYATASTSTSNPPAPGNMSGHYEVDEDYEDPYWDPSSKEDELRMQLQKLKVPEIPREDLQFQEYLGSGQFGTVNRGVWSPSPSSSNPGVEVAVKSLEGESTEEERVKFLQEAAIMGQFKHPNIIRIAGVITTSDPLLIVCEMMHKGDLHRHLLSMRSHSGVCVEMPAQLLSFCRQIAFGMTYLSNKSYVHRDLAARNILVSMYDICKIADFGLSRDLQNEDYYVSHGGKIPVKWTAPEALNYRKYSTASDVWSYGVLLYEIWAMGIKPFHDCTNSESLKKVLAGNRLPPPPGCPRAIYELMIHSWHSQPASRPTFTDMVVLLQRPDFQLLWWSEEDKTAYSEKARTLGGPVEDGEEMYTELQNTYVELAAD